MTAGLEMIQTGEVTRAVRAVHIDGLHVEEGQIIGLLNGTLTTQGQTVDQVVFSLLEQMQADDYEIVTVYYGESVTPDEAASLADRMGETYPEQEIELVDGGQPHYFYIISAE
jgi:dihydroxyacetone kinase-like predicted kinase